MVSYVQLYVWLNVINLIQKCGAWGVTWFLAQTWQVLSCQPFYDLRARVHSASTWSSGLGALGLGFRVRGLRNGLSFLQLSDASTI